MPPSPPRGEGIQVLVRSPVQSCIRGSDDAAKIAETFFIDLVIFEKLCVVAKIPKKPVEFPESSFGAIQPSGEEAGFEGFRFQNNNSDLYEWLLWMGDSAISRIELFRNPRSAGGDGCQQ